MIDLAAGSSIHNHGVGRGGRDVEVKRGNSRERNSRERGSRGRRSRRLGRRGRREVRKREIRDGGRQCSQLERDR